MSDANQFDNFSNNSDGEAENAVSDTYTAESSEDLYRTPDLSSDVTQTEGGDKVTEPLENVSAEAEIISEGGVYDGGDSQNASAYSGQDAPDRNPYDASYSGQIVTSSNACYGQNIQNNNPYDNGTYNNDNPYAGNGYNGNYPYGAPYSGQNGQNNNPYDSNSYGGQNAQNNNPYGSNSYGGQNAQNNNPYGNNAYNGQNAQSSSPYGNNPYGGQNTQNSNPYGSNSYGGQNVQNNYQNPYGNPPYGNGNNGNNPYSPYAVPPKKNNTGLIIGIVIGIIVLFLIAVFALAYKVVNLYTSEKDKKRNTREEYDFDDYDDDVWDRNRDNDYDDDHHGYYDDDYFYDDYDYPFGDDFPYDYDYDYDDFFGGDNGGDVDDDRYYSLHNEIRDDLQYSIKLEDYRYDTTYENVDIQVTYPVIEGQDVPNLDKLNGAIKDEVDFITEYFEEEYQDYMLDDDDYFMATSTGYVTYMDEEKMSVAFSEYIYSDYYNDVFVYCINIDMENGIILDNESLLNTDDDFSVEFRKRSDVQNGEISYLTAMTDQEITKHFKSSDIIVFYIPQGMEIGFNYDAGWVTVTYEDFEKYLKVF